jgi:hypothetical protein
MPGTSISPILETKPKGLDFYFYAMIGGITKHMKLNEISTRI